MSPDCNKLGLDVREISIAAGTGAASATNLSRVKAVYVCKTAYPNIIWEIPVLMTYPDIYRDIPN